MDDPDVMELTQNDGCVRLFGLPFLLGGLAALIIPPLAAFADPKALAGMVVSIPLGLIFTAVGSWLVLGRTGVTLDRRAGVVSSWWGVLFVWSRKEYPLSDAKAVTIRAEQRKSKNSSYTVYPVRVEGADFKLGVREFREFEDSRGLSERISKFLNLDIHDYSAGEMRVRKVEFLDETLRDRAKRKGKLPEPPPMPQDCKIAHRVEGDEAIFELPKAGPGCAIASCMGAGIAAVLFIFTFWPVAFVFGLAMSVMAFALVKALITDIRIKASSQRLRLEEQTPLWISAKEIPASELEELLVSSSKIVARSDRRTLQFGETLTGPDREWLLGVLTTILSSGPSE